MESASLHLRKILELIIFGSLVTNRLAVQQIAAAFASKDVSEARKIARRANKEYWPEALEPKSDSTMPVNVSGQVYPATQMKPRVAQDYLREEDWGKAFGDASVLLHAWNQYSPPIDAERQFVNLQTWGTKVVNLLNHHRVRLVDRGYFLACQMKARPEGNPKAPFDVDVAVFQLVAATPKS